jgi:AcrR family transcriptional regulator
MHETRAPLSAALTDNSPLALSRDHTVLYCMEERLDRNDWLRAARRALLHGGPAAVRVDRLATQLGVTRGSFYWHFENRADLMESLLREWEDELRDALASLPPVQGPAAVGELTRFLAPRVAASERGEVPSDAAIFAWAAADPEVAVRVNAAEDERVALLKQIAGDDDIGEFLYLAYLGFVMRRRRSPAAAAYFPVLARLMGEVAAVLGTAAATEAEQQEVP